MKAYEEGKGPVKKRRCGPCVKGQLLGMTMSFGSVARNKRHKVSWAMLERTLSKLFHTWVLSTHCVPNPMPDSEVRYGSGLAAKLPKLTGCLLEGKACRH